MKVWKQIIAAFVVTVGMSGALLAPNVGAIEVFDQCANNPDSTVCKSKNDNATSMIKIVINTALVVLGMVAVLMIIIGAIRYTTSNGDPSSVKGAKNTILYSVIGLVVAILAYSIVNFVVARF